MKLAVNSCNWDCYAKAVGGLEDFEKFLSEAKEAGCDGVEVGGLDKVFASPAEAKRTIAGYGLEIAAYGAAVTYNPWPPNTEDYQRAIRFAAKLDVEVLMVCGGFLGNSRRNTNDSDYDIFAGSLAAAVKFAKEHGMRIAFHPHRGCICETKAETRKIIDRVPELELCADIAHLSACGDDAVAFIRHFADKIIHTHIKDYDGRADRFMELGKGDGNLDIPACIRALQDASFEGWLTIELDRAWDESLPTPLESTRISADYLSSFLPPTGEAHPVRREIAR